MVPGIGLLMIVAIGLETSDLAKVHEEALTPIVSPDETSSVRETTTGLFISQTEAGISAAKLKENWNL